MYNQWDNVYGVSMKSFSKELRASKGSKPEILTIKPEDLLGTEVALCWINLREDESHDLNSYSIEHVVGKI